jgi:cob(I)alamin adenosyltransferase
MKLYTRGGDQGSTGLFGGDRVTKSHPRLMAYGTLDELNSVIGLLRLHASPAVVGQDQLQQIQHDLFVLGAILATPASRLDMLGEKMTRTTWTLEQMESDIDRLSELAPPMKHFVLPGGTTGAAHAHVARTVCRRAEREVVMMTNEEPVDSEVVKYLNRLSDWLFALARAENAVNGVQDVEWIPK